MKKEFSSSRSHNSADISMPDTTESLFGFLWRNRRKIKPFLPSKKFLLACFLELLLLVCSVSRLEYSALHVQLFRLSLLEICFPVIMWLMVNERAFSRRSPGWKWGWPYTLLILLPIIGAVFSLFWAFLVIKVAVGEAFVSINDIGILLDRNLVFWMAFCGILFLVSIYWIFRKSLWHFVTLSLALSGWCFFCYTFNSLNSFISASQALSDLRLGFTLFLIGLLVSFAFFLVIYKKKRKSVGSW